MKSASDMQMLHRRDGIGHVSPRALGAAREVIC